MRFAVHHLKKRKKTPLFKPKSSQFHTERFYGLDANALCYRSSGFDGNVKPSAMGCMLFAD